MLIKHLQGSENVFRLKYSKNTSARPRGNISYKVQQAKYSQDRKPRFLADFYLKHL